MTTSAPDERDGLRERVREAARAARRAAGELAQARTAAKNGALEAIADALLDRSAELLDANAKDVERARAAGMPESGVDRLALTGARVEGVAAGLRQVVALADPVGEVTRGTTLPNGLRLRQIRVPFGVLGMVYEGRPNVTVDAAGLALKSGNAVLLRGSSSAESSNEALVAVMRDAVRASGFPADAVTLLPCHDRASVRHLITARGLVDLVIPRGGAALISAVTEQATVPTVETGVGNCHVYVDSAAELDMAERIVRNSKSRRVSVCNAAETVLVHADVASAFLPALLRGLAEDGVTVHGDPAVVAVAAGGAGVVPATERDWDTEYLSHDLAVRVVTGLDEALAHVAEHSTGHTEAIVTANLQAAETFTARVDAAAVMVNAATSFTDGEQFGMGAEIGISTQKSHARGPMGLPELTTTKWIVWGDGQVRPTS